jgi:CTP synthase
MFCNVHEDDVISNEDVDNIYAVSLIFEKQDLCKKILHKLNLRRDNNEMAGWERFIKKIRTLKTPIKIGIVGKYFDIGTSQLSDSYISVIEAVKHAAWNNNLKPDIRWIDSKVFEKDPKKLKTLDKLHGIIVPGGFGSSGIDGKLETIKYAREKGIPYLGLCLGMQLAVVEYAQNVCKIAGSNTVEVDKKAKAPVIDFIPEQVEIIQESRYGATMRLGAWPAILKKGTKVFKLYGSSKISERHRHRYEVNPEYVEKLEKCGLVFSGRSPDDILMEFMEVPNHPYFIATQAHPEFKSRPMKPAPLFDGLIKAAKKRK